MILSGYYAILDVPDGAPLITGAGVSRTLQDRAARLLAAAPCMLQLRAKAASAAALAALARALLPLARAAAVPLCVNDRLDVALAVGADAVHLGQDDLPLSAAQSVAGGRLRIGISTHTVAQATAAVLGGADYIGFGPVFATATKVNPDPLVGLDRLREIVTRVAAAGVPVVAIGGISMERLEAVAATGAAAAALIGAIDRADDPTAAGRMVRAAFGRPA